MSPATSSLATSSSGGAASSSGGAAGSSTSLITCITPLEASMSAVTTFAELIETVPMSSLTVTSAPLTVATFRSLAPMRSELITLPGITWYVSTAVRVSVSARSCSAVSPRAAKALANASSVGANTVNGPSPCKVSTNPAAWTAATRVGNWPAETATSMMSPATSSLATSSSGGAASCVSLPQLASSKTATTRPVKAVLNDFMIPP